MNVVKMGTNPDSTQSCFELARWIICPELKGYVLERSSNPLMPQIMRTLNRALDVSVEDVSHAKPQVSVIMSNYTLFLWAMELNSGFTSHQNLPQYRMTEQFIN